MRLSSQFARLALFLFLANAAIGAPPEGIKTNPFEETRDRLLKQGSDAALSTKDQFALAVALFGNGEFSAARTVAQLGIGLARTPEEKALFHVVLSQSFGALGRYTHAAQTALIGQRLDPRSKELAALRLAYFHKLADQAQAEAARDTLRHLEPSGTPVLNAAQVLATISGIGTIIKAIYAVGVEVKKDWPRIKQEFETIAVAMKGLWTVKVHQQ